MEYITPPQIHYGLAEGLETYSGPHSTTQKTILGLEKQVLWGCGRPETTESHNGTHFQNNLVDNWAKNIVLSGYNTLYCTPASRKNSAVQ